MLTRRQLLTAVVAAPLAKFCKTASVRPFNAVWTGELRAVTCNIDVPNGVVVFNSHLLKPGTFGWIE